jgi:hypothetical protein
LASPRCFWKPRQGRNVAGRCEVCVPGAGDDEGVAPGKGEGCLESPGQPSVVGEGCLLRDLRRGRLTDAPVHSATVRRRDGECRRRSRPAAALWRNAPISASETAFLAERAKPIARAALHHPRMQSIRLDLALPDQSEQAAADFGLTTGGVHRARLCPGQTRNGGCPSGVWPGQSRAQRTTAPGQHALASSATAGRRSKESRSAACPGRYGGMWTGRRQRKTGWSRRDNSCCFAGSFTLSTFWTITTSAISREFPPKVAPEYLLENLPGTPAEIGRLPLQSHSDGPHRPR